MKIKVLFSGFVLMAAIVSYETSIAKNCQCYHF